MKEEKQLRNVSIELLRIVAFCMVILNHILNRHYTTSSGEIYNTVCFMNMFNIVAVPCFFMITGYFSFDQYSIKQSMKKCLWRIVLPTAIVIVLTLQIYPVVTSGGGANIDWAECFRFDIDTYANLWSNLRGWSVSIYGISHLWYIQAYVKIVLLMPVLAMLCSGDARVTQARRYIIILILTGILIRNWMISRPNDWMVSPYIPFDVCTLAVLLGYEVRNDEVILKRNWLTCCVAFIGYIICSIIGYGLEMDLISRENVFNDYYFHYESIPCQLASVCFFVMFVIMPVKVNQRISKVISVIGKATFPAYLLQGLVLIPVSTVVDGWGIFHGTVKYVISAVLCIVILIVVSLPWIIIESLIKKKRKSRKEEKDGISNSK